MVTDFSDLKKILIVRLSSIGDILLTTPLIRSIKKKYPSVQIDFLVKKEFAETVRSNPNLKNVYTYGNHSKDRQTLKNKLVSENYEIVIDLQNNFRSRDILRPLGCKILSFRKNNLKKFLLVHFKINLLKNSPQIPLRYAEAAGLSELDNEGLEFYTDKLYNKNLSKEGNYIGLCPGAKHFTKRWPKDYFIELGKKLELANYKILLFGGPEEAQICDEIMTALKSAQNLCGTSLLQVAADMKLCRAIYTNDSGLMHLASAVKVPVIAFFGSTVKEFGFFPYNAESIELEIKNLSCRPCTHIGRKNCPKNHFNCMREIKPDYAFYSLTNLDIS